MITLFIIGIIVFTVKLLLTMHYGDLQLCWSQVGGVTEKGE